MCGLTSSALSRFSPDATPEVFEGVSAENAAFGGVLVVPEGVTGAVLSAVGFGIGFAACAGLLFGVCGLTSAKERTWKNFGVTATGSNLVILFGRVFFDLVEINALFEAFKENILNLNLYSFGLANFLREAA